MKTIILALLLISPACYPETITQNGLQVSVLKDDYEAPIAIPLYFTYELTNISNAAICVPAREDVDIILIVTGPNGGRLSHNGPIENRVGGHKTIFLSPGQKYLESVHLNGIFGYFALEGQYSVSLQIKSEVALEPSSVSKDPCTCWQGNMITEKVFYKVQSPPTQQDREAYALVTKFSPIPDAHSYPPKYKELYEKYPETIYAALAYLDGFHHKTDKYPNEAILMRKIISLYPDSAISRILEFRFSGFADPDNLDKKIEFLNKFSNKYKGTAWEEKAQKRIAWFEECKKNKSSDACKYPKRLY